MMPQQEQFIQERRLDFTNSIMCPKRRAMPPQSEPSSSPKRRRTEPHVWFPTKEVIQTAPSTMVITDDEWDNLWYQNEDILTLRKDVLNYVVKGIPVDETRGLERFQWSRDKEKTEARRCTLEAYRMLGIRGNKFAEVVQILTSKARSEVFLTGCNDYCEAYHPEMKDALVDLAKNFLKDQQGEEAERG